MISEMMAIIITGCGGDERVGDSLVSITPVGPISPILYISDFSNMGIKHFEKQYPAFKGLISQDGHKEALVQSYEQLLDPRGPSYTMGTDCLLHFYILHVVGLGFHALFHFVR